MMMMIIFYLQNYKPKWNQIYKSVNQHDRVFMLNPVQDTIVNIRRFSFMANQVWTEFSFAFQTGGAEEHGMWV